MKKNKYLIIRKTGKGKDEANYLIGMKKVEQFPKRESIAVIVSVPGFLLREILNEKAPVEHLSENNEKWTFGDFDVVLKKHEFHSVLLVAYNGARIDEICLRGKFEDASLEREASGKTPLGKFYLEILGEN